MYGHTHSPELDYLACLRPKHPDVSDAYGVSRCSTCVQTKNFFPDETQEWNGRVDDPDPEREGMNNDVGCKCANNNLAGSHLDSMVPASKVTYI